VVPESSTVDSHLAEETEFSEAVEQASRFLNSQSGCTDTKDWKNKWNNGCAAYAKLGFCADGKPVKKWAMGKGNNSPELNCCVCGGGKKTAAKKVVPLPKFRVVTKIGARPASTHYSASVRSVGDKEWKKSLVMQVTAKKACAQNDKDCENCGYFAKLNDWTQSFTNFELDEKGEVEVLVQRLGKPIKRARVHPAKSGAKVYKITPQGVVIRLTKNARFHVDVDGGFDETDTGPSYHGKPMHSMAVFANPILQDPDLKAPKMLVVTPEDWKDGKNPLKTAPAKGTTVVFTAGEHRPTNFDKTKYEFPTVPAYDDVNYFFSRDAIVYATLLKAGKGPKGWMFGDFQVAGYGILSGEDMSRKNFKTGKCSPNKTPSGIKINSSGHGKVSGVTILDFPNHHIILQGGKGTSTLTNVKVLGWRANGDGTHVFGKWKVDNQFYRTQDDSMYIHSGDRTNGNDASTFSDITTWNDANGAAFIVAGYGGKLLNSNSIYHRTMWSWWLGGRIFTHRAKPGDGTSFVMNATSISVENFVSQDPFPSLNAFQLESMNDELVHNPSWHGVAKAKVAVSNIKFTNVEIAAAATPRKCTVKNGCNCYPKCALGGNLPHGMPNVIYGYDDKTAWVNNIEFNNVKIAGVDVNDMLMGKAPGYFNVTGAVSDVYADGEEADVDHGDEVMELEAEAI